MRGPVPRTLGQRSAHQRPEDIEQGENLMGAPLQFRAVVGHQGPSELFASFGEAVDILGVHRAEVRRIFKDLFPPGKIGRRIRHPVIDLSEVRKHKTSKLVRCGEEMQAVLSRVLSLSENRLERAGHSRTPQVWDEMILKDTLARIAADHVIPA